MRGQHDDAGAETGDDRPPRGRRGRRPDGHGSCRSDAGVDDRRLVGCVGRDGQVVVEVAGVGVELQVRQPHVAGTHSMPTSERRSASRPARRRLAALDRRGPGPPASSFGLLVGQQEHVGLDPRWASSPRPRMRSGTHGSSVGIVAMIGVPSPAPWPRSRGPLGVEAGGHEDRAALGVEVEHLGCVGRQEEPVVDGPLARPRRRRPRGP